MNPAYHNMQLVIIDRHTECYTYGDVIAFRCDKLDALLVKRVAACPGDDVVIRDGVLYVNNVVSIIFSQEYLFEYAGLASNIIHLSENEYFVIGDNITFSKDSRYSEIGCINIHDIWGKVI